MSIAFPGNQLRTPSTNPDGDDLGARVESDPLLDRFTSNAYDLVIDGDSYRQRLKPGKTAGQRRPTKAA